MRHWDRSHAINASLVHRKWAVEETRAGTVVATADLRHDSYGYHPRKFAVSIMVDPGHQHRGIGRELAALLEREALERQAISLWCHVRDGDARSMAFASRHGFATVRKQWVSRLEVTSANRASLVDRSNELESRGFRFTTIAREGVDRPEVRERLYRLGQTASADVPRIGTYTPISREEFFAHELEGPGFLADGLFLAVRGEEYVGMSSLERDLKAPDSLHIGFTGTDPRFRGLGLATELKRRAVEYARGHGYRALHTTNDSLNRPIWAINEKLGFRPQLTWIQAEKKIEATHA